MKRLQAGVFFCICTFHLFPQSFWTETFGTGCTQGLSANAWVGTTGTWSETLTGQNGSSRNKWYVSSTETGMSVGSCGDGCLNNPALLNRTLHIGSDIPMFIDPGANYLAGSPNYNTHVRIESPLINCTGQNSIQLSFKYLAEGVPGVDFFDLHYSSNGGTTWSVIAVPPPTFNQICTPQGLWTNYSIMLPVSANNNPNVKIGFRWQNTDPTGADPSVAIDDITLGPPSTTLQKEEKQNVFNVFPNPVKDKLFISSNITSEVNVEIVDALGKTLLKQTFNFIGDNTESIKIGSLPPGIYLAKIASSKQTSVMRFIKE